MIRLSYKNMNSLTHRKIKLYGYVAENCPLVYEYEHIFQPVIS